MIVKDELYLYRFPEMRSRFDRALCEYRRLVPRERQHDTLVLDDKQLLTVNMEVAVIQ